MSDAAASRARAAIGWLALLLLLGWTSCVHHGIGPLKPGSEGHWYATRAFLFEHDATASLLEPPALAFAVLALPALLLAAVVALASGSALASAIAVGCTLATALFVFYGTRAPLPWQFFGWRGSAVLWSVALVLLAIPVAIVINAIRVFLTGFLVFFVSPEMGEGFMHLTEGWLMFVIAFGILGGIAWGLTRGESWWRRRKEAARS